MSTTTQLSGVSRPFSLRFVRPVVAGMKSSLVFGARAPALARMVSIQVTSSHAPVQYRRPFRLRAGSTAWCVAAVHTGAVSTDRVTLLDGPEPRAHPMDVDPGAKSRGRPHRG